MFFISLLIAIQFSIAFWMIGNPEDVASGVIAVIIATFALTSFDRAYFSAIVSLFLFFIPTVQGYQFIHLVLLVMLFSIIIYRDNVIDSELNRRHFFNVLMFVFAIYITVSIIWCQNILTITYSYYNIISLFLVYLFTIYYLQNQGRILLTLKVWAITGIIYAFARIFISPASEESSFTLFTAKNTVSSLLNFSTFAFMAFFTMENDFFKRNVMRIIMLMLMVVNFFIGSKAGFASFILIALVYYIIVNRKKMSVHSWILKTVSGFFIIFIIAQIFLVPFLYMNLHFYDIPISPTDELSTLIFRFQQWDYGKQMIENSGNYLLGLGINGYGILYGDYYTGEQLPELWQNHPHSIYVHVFCDYGIIGMIIFIIINVTFIALMTNFICKTKNPVFRIINTAILLAIFSFYIHALVDWALAEKQYWFFIGTGMAVIFVDRKNRHENKPIPEIQP